MLKESWKCGGGGIQRAAGRTGPFMKRKAGTERRGRVGVGGERKGAAVLFSGGFNVKQWKARCADVNKDG